MIRRREMQMINTNLLGTGYKLLRDKLSTIPMLLCTNRIGYPNLKTNSLNSKSPQGSIRWLRNDSILFLQWKDMRGFSVFTLHTFHREDTVQQRVKGADGQWTLRDIPVPPAVKEYIWYVLRIQVFSAF